MSYSEEEIVKILNDRFDSITASVKRPRRLWLDSPREGFLDVLTYIHDDLDFILLCTMTGIDDGDGYRLIYHLSHDCGFILSAAVHAPHENPVFDTASDIYKGGVLFELEARNLLGLTILGIPEDIRYPLPDGWPEGSYPLRKDWVAPQAGKDKAEGVAPEGDASGSSTAPASDTTIISNAPTASVAAAATAANYVAGIDAAVKNTTVTTTKTKENDNA